MDAKIKVSCCTIFYKYCTQKINSLASSSSHEHRRDSINSSSSPSSYLSSLPSLSSRSGCTKSIAPSWSEALQFTLTIGSLSNGRRYEAKRDFASFFKLRDDLLVEQYDNREGMRYDDVVVEIPHLPLDTLTNHMNNGKQSLSNSFSGLEAGMKAY